MEISFSAATSAVPLRANKDALGKKGGKITAKRGPDYFRKIGGWATLTGKHNSGLSLT